jgi:acyl-CoA thioesterase
MFLSEILGAMRAEGMECSIEVGEDWGQGRATFGGLVAAAGNEAMRRLVPRDRALRSLQTTFVGPALPGTWNISTRVLRVGRAVTSTQCEIHTQGEVAAVLVGVYGAARSSRVEVPVAANPQTRAVEDIKEVRMPLEGMPKCLQHFAVRWIEGPALFTGIRTPGKAFIHHRDPAPLTESHLVALTDCLPPSAMSMYATPAPASSLVWTLEFVKHDFNFPPDAWWRVEHDIDAAKEGYVNQTGTLYDPNGAPAALSRQLVAIFG